MPSDNNYNFVSFVNTLILICMLKKSIWASEKQTAVQGLGKGGGEVCYYLRVVVVLDGVF